ncbi:MAG: phosphatase PAP2 family protein [Burkholderiaceae bacterium]
MTNHHLFELLNAAPGLDALDLGLALFLAEWVIYLVPLALAIAWLRGDVTTQRELLRAFTAMLVSLALAQAVAHLWPQPRPLALHLGTQYLTHSVDPGMPSDHVTVIWTLALWALTSARFGLWGFPLLALGLIVGWSRVYLGVHFPFDVLAAFPVALCGVVIARVLRRTLVPVETRVLSLYDGCAGWLGAKLASARKA